MKFSIPILILLTALLTELAGCSGVPAQRSATANSSIRQEVNNAVQSMQPKAVPPSIESVQDALLPPIQTDPGKKVSDRFDLAVQNAPVTQVLMAIANGTPYSMLISSDVTGNVTLDLKNVTIKEALDTLRDLYGYEYRVQGTRIMILPNTLQTRVFQLNYLSGRRTGSTDVRITSSSISGNSGNSNGTNGNTSSTSSSGSTGSNNGNGNSSGGGASGYGSTSVTTRSDADFWGDVRQALTTIVGNAEGRSMVLNSESGVIVVRALPAEIRNVEAYLRATQLVIERQVMLEAKIIEVNLSDGYQAGVNWAAFSQGNNSQGAFGQVDNSTSLRALGNAAAGLANGSVSAIPGAGGSLTGAGSGAGFFGLAFQTSNFAALLNFLQTQGTINVLSSPRIATLNNQKAVLKVGNDDYYVTGVTAGSTVVGTTGTTTNTPTFTTQVFFSGIALDVTPQIDDNENIVLHVHPAISSVSNGAVAIPTGDANVKQIFLPTNAIRESDSIVRVQDGRIVAIGGLMKQSVNNTRNQLPGLGDAPVVGEAFGNRNNQSQKQELVILIKPTIIRGDSSWQQDLLDVQERMNDYAPHASADK